MTENGANGSITATDLMALEFAPARFVVPGLVGEGLTLLAGPPKIGKSMLMLDIAVAVATGGEALGSFPCEAANVLYLALEDGKRRVRERLQKILGSDPVPDRLSFMFECRRLGEGALEDLRIACRAREPQVLIVDVLELIRPARKPHEGAYALDYRTLSGLQQMAIKLGIAIVVVHHTRKAPADDPLDRVSGTTGLTGAADAVLTLYKGAAGRVLDIRSRDIEDTQHKLKFENGCWSVEGSPGDAALSETAQRVIEFLRTCAEAMSPKQVACALGIMDTNARQTLLRLAKRGQIQKDAHGLYKAVTSVTTVTDEDDWLSPR
jgi:hypothetical protein